MFYIKFSIAIDGTSASGKGTLAKLLAKHFCLQHIDTGAMYRCIALIGLRNNDFSELFLESAVKSTTITFSDSKVLLDGTDVTSKIRSDEISILASKKVAILPKVRAALVEKQRKMAEKDGIVMEGRDITSVVLPNAKYKLFVDADVSVRAQRRFDELASLDKTLKYETVLNELEIRDSQDYSRKDSPLLKVYDAIVIDATNKTAQDVFKETVNKINERM